MAIKLTTTREAAQSNGIKMLVYGGAGSGKTTLASTTGGKTLIVSAESGLMSLRDHDIDAIEVSTIDDVFEAYQYVQSGDGLAYEWICLDSLSEIAEACLAAEKKNTQDPRAAYGETAEKMLRLIKEFRDLPQRNIYMSAKMSREKDESTGAFLYGAMMPGRQLGPQLPYLFDLVCAMRCETNAEGESVRSLQTFKDLQYDCKDRSGVLESFESPNLSTIRSKINQPKGSK
jgi:phage nucleotide-binding protein